MLQVSGQVLTNRSSLFQNSYLCSMTGFEPGCSGIGSDRAVNCTTILVLVLFCLT